MPKLLVFCIDALCASDIAYMKTLPHFGRLLREGALVENIDPVFPKRVVKDFLIKFTKKPQKKCQKQILAPDTFADGLFSPA